MSGRKSLTDDEKRLAAQYLARVDAGTVVEGEPKNKAQIARAFGVGERQMRADRLLSDPVFQAAYAAESKRQARIAGLGVGLETEAKRTVERRRTQRVNKRVRTAKAREKDVPFVEQVRDQVVREILSDDEDVSQKAREFYMKWWGKQELEEVAVREESGLVGLSEEELFLEALELFPVDVVLAGLERAGWIVEPPVGG